MEDKYNYWISLIHEQEYEVLEEELREQVLFLNPSWEQQNIPDISTEDAIDIAEGYLCSE